MHQHQESQPRGLPLWIIKVNIKATSHLSIAVFKLLYGTNSCFPCIGPDLDPEEIPIDDEDELEELDE